MALPIKFEDLDEKELYRSALEDFAVDVKDSDTKKVLLAGLLEAGVTWKDYVAQHPEVVPAIVEEIIESPARHNKTPGAVVTAEATTGRSTRARTLAPERAVEGDVYLVKMNRDNPYFEFSGYKFTKKNPFVVMSADATNAILTLETGFSIATPAEAQEYYG